MTCEKCIHSSVCETYVTYGGDWHAEKCDHFKPKSRFVELPCELGSTVYEVFDGRVYEKEVISITILFASYVKRINIHCQNSRGALTACGAIDFGETVFLSREDAEKALAERSK